jgi:hypothetical protein
VAQRPDPSHGVEGLPQRWTWQSGTRPCCGVDGRCRCLGEASLARPSAKHGHGQVPWAALGFHLVMTVSDLSSSTPLAAEWLYNAMMLWAHLTINNTFSNNSLTETKLIESSHVAPDFFPRFFLVHDAYLFF